MSARDGVKFTFNLDKEDLNSPESSQYSATGSQLYTSLKEHIDAAANTGATGLLKKALNDGGNEWATDNGKAVLAKALVYILTRKLATAYKATILKPILEKLPLSHIDYLTYISGGITNTIIELANDGVGGAKPDPRLAAMIGDMKIGSAAAA